MKHVGFASALLLLCLSSFIIAAEKNTVDRVVDGDTFVLTSGEKVRLIGIDAPESQDPNKPVEYFADESKRQLERLIAGKSVRLEYEGDRADKYGRLLCYVWVKDTVLVNLEMIKSGHATAYLRFEHSKQDKFLSAEVTARKNALGMWASPRAKQESVEKPKETKQADSDVIVYITKTGAKYHRGSCSYLRKSKSPTKKSEAISRGYTPCSRCRP